MSLSYSVRCSACGWSGEMAEARTEKVQVEAVDLGVLDLVEAHFCPECGEQVHFE